MRYTTLIRGAELAPHLDDVGWCVVDCRHDLADPEAGRRAWADAHIPGAVFAHCDADLAGPRRAGSGRHPLPDPQALVARLRAWGIGNQTQVVAYDAHGGSFAARLWWLLRWLGHDAVAVLDGGLPAWIEAGLPTDRSARPRAAGSFTAGTPLARSVDAARVLATRGDPASVLIDARAPERFSGATEPIDPVGGHIPGAINRFWQQNLQGGRFKPAPQLRAEFDALLAGRAPEQLIAQCGSGVTACHHLLALAHAGLHGAALYPGSWSEWVADPARPVARGA